MRTLFTNVLLTVSLVAIESSLLAQPVLVNTMTPFPVGTIDSIYSASGTVAAGSGGAGVTWNLSALSPSLLGTVTIITPSTSPYFSTFPTTTFCAQITPTGGSSVYSYERLSSAKWETLANNYSGTGTGTDYTPNPESAVEFPMNYTNSFIDTFQKTTGGPSTVTITYDGYGTLITPFATYSNVVRIQKYWGVGDYDFNWYVTSPSLGIVASYHAQSNSYTLVRDAGTTSVKQTLSQTDVQLYPNPLSQTSVLKISSSVGLNNASIAIADMTGRIVQQTAVTNTETAISKKGLTPGLYFYQVFNDGVKVANGKLIIE